MKYPWEFSQHSLGKRLLATYGGALALLLAGVIISIGNYYTLVDSFISKAEVDRLGIYPSAAALEDGFMPGDRITAINGKDYQKFDDLFRPPLVLAPEVKYTVLRDGQEIQITVTDLISKLQIARQRRNLSVAMCARRSAPGRARVTGRSDRRKARRSNQHDKRTACTEIFRKTGRIPGGG